VNRVVPDEQLDAEAGALAARLAAGPPRSFAATKRLVNALHHSGLEEQLEIEAVLQQELIARTTIRRASRRSWGSAARSFAGFEVGGRGE
jgi:enoyl-CoA hydratase/carnithine racemase